MLRLKSLSISQSPSKNTSNCIELIWKIVLLWGLFFLLSFYAAQSWVLSIYFYLFSSFMESTVHFIELAFIGQFTRLFGARKLSQGL